MGEDDPIAQMILDILFQGEEADFPEFDERNDPNVRAQALFLSRLAQPDATRARGNVIPPAQLPSRRQMAAREMSGFEQFLSSAVSGMKQGSILADLFLPDFGEPDVERRMPGVELASLIGAALGEPGPPVRPLKGFISAFKKNPEELVRAVIEEGPSFDRAVQSESTGDLIGIMHEIASTMFDVSSPQQKAAARALTRRVGLEINERARQGDRLARELHFGPDANMPDLSQIKGLTEEDYLQIVDEFMYDQQIQREILRDAVKGAADDVEEYEAMTRFLMNLNRNR